MTRTWRLLALAAGALAPPAAGGTSPQLELDLRLDPPTRALLVIATLPARGEFDFRLHRALEVHHATSDGKRLEVERLDEVGAQRRWRVRSPRAAELRIEYGGTLPATDRSLDHREVLRGLVPMAAAEGSFLPAMSGWYPTPGALFSYRVRLSLPGDQRGLVAGTLIDERLPRSAGDRYVATFEFSQNADGIDLMAGPYSIRERIVPGAGGRSLRLRTYFFPDLDALADGYLEDSARYIAHYSERIGDYPFSAFSIVASPLPTGFGMPTLTYVGAQVLRLPFIRGSSLGHEVLHNWWGNGVYVDYASGNWAEGLTTFMADYAFKEQDSARAALEMRQGWLRDFAAVPAGELRKLSEFRSRTHGAAAAVGYGKSAMLFFMLRDWIGEPAFEQGLREFWRENRFRTASWSDLRAAFERASGAGLVSFFEQWLERAGAPALDVSDVRASMDLRGGYELSFVLEQTAPAYRLRVPIEIVAAGRATTHWIDIDRPKQRVALRLVAKPERLQLDPEVRLWRALAPEELPPILRQWILARSPKLALAGADPGLRTAALELAARFFERPPPGAQPASVALSGAEPIMIMGFHEQIDAELRALGLPGRPAELSGRGTAQVWTLAGNSRQAPVAVVSVRDADSLRALLRPLPHYGSQSFLAFDGARAIERGVWPAPGKVHVVTQ